MGLVRDILKVVSETNKRPDMDSGAADSGSGGSSGEYAGTNITEPIPEGRRAMKRGNGGKGNGR